MSDEVKPTGPITFDELDRVHIKVGRVLTAERVEGSKGGKLLKLSVDLGEFEPRTVVSGIGLTFVPETLVGNQYAFITNLAPRKMMGIESQAMILATGEADKLALCNVPPPAQPGSRLG